MKEFDPEELFLVTPVGPHESGLSQCVYVLDAPIREEPQVWLGDTDRAVCGHFWIITICDAPEVIGEMFYAPAGGEKEPKQLSSINFQRAQRWIKLNRIALLDHWNERSSSVELYRSLTKLD